MPSNERRELTRLISEASESLQIADSYLIGDLWVGSIIHAEAAVKKLKKVKTLAERLGI